MTAHLTPAAAAAQARKLGVLSADQVEQPDFPAEFASLVQKMANTRLRPELTCGVIRPPQRLASFSYALGIEVAQPEPDIIPTEASGDAFGRLVMLYEPAGEKAWGGTTRMVAYIQADLEQSVAGDPLLPEVAWQWLTEALEQTGAGFSHVGGTVTSTTSVRFGDIGGKAQAYQIELRASWTATNEQVDRHVQAFATMLASVAGLPPEGVTTLPYQA